MSNFFIILENFLQNYSNIPIFFLTFKDFHKISHSLCKLFSEFSQNFLIFLQIFLKIQFIYFSFSQILFIFYKKMFKNFKESFNVLVLIDTILLKIL